MDKNRYQATNPGGLKNTKEENISPQTPPQLNWKKKKSRLILFIRKKNEDRENITWSEKWKKFTYRGIQIKMIVDKQEENRVKYFVVDNK